MVNEIATHTLSSQSKPVFNDVKPVKLEIAHDSLLESNQETKPTEESSSISMVTDTVNRLNETVQSIERDLQFQVDDTSGDTIITVLDTKTNEVIRQIPTEDVLAARENIETLKGIIFSAKV